MSKLPWRHWLSPRNANPNEIWTPGPDRSIFFTGKIIGRRHSDALPIPLSNKGLLALNRILSDLTAETLAGMLNNVQAVLHYGH